MEAFSVNKFNVNNYVLSHKNVCYDIKFIIYVTLENVFMVIREIEVTVPV